MGSCEGPQEAINKSDLQSVEKMESLTSFDNVSSYKIGDIFLAWYVSCDDILRVVEGLQKGRISKLVFWLDLDFDLKPLFPSCL